MVDNIKKNIVISGINLREGGTLTILKDCLHYLSLNLSESYNIIGLVSEKSLTNFSNIKYIEFPSSKKSWLLRLFYEYIYFYFLSKKIHPYLWLSLHDITPNVKAKIRAVYCHNPSPFYQSNLKTCWLAPKMFLFSKLYKYLYEINIKKNNFIIVQQQWIKKAFESMYKVNSVIVSQPINPLRYQEKLPQAQALKNYQFIYPAFPRVFKNFETICEAAELLEKKGINNFTIILTILGNENKYSKYIYKKFYHLKTVKFIGLLSHEKLFDLYSISDCLIFPSKLETWGLPITEFSMYKKPILLINLPYAHETIGDYPLQYFFEPDDSESLSQLMFEAIQMKLLPNIKKMPTSSSATKLAGWEALFKYMLK